MESIESKNEEGTELKKVKTTETLVTKTLRIMANEYIERGLISVIHGEIDRTLGINAVLGLIQGELSVGTKKTDGVPYSYRSAEDITTALTPLLAKYHSNATSTTEDIVTYYDKTINETVIKKTKETQTAPTEVVIVTETTTGSKSVGRQFLKIRVTFRYKTDFISESYLVEINPPGKGLGCVTQQFGSVISYAQKYALKLFFYVSDGTIDLDSIPIEKAKPPKPAVQQPPEVTHNNNTKPDFYRNRNDYKGDM